jgi:hypothetical protein
MRALVNICILQYLHLAHFVHWPARACLVGSARVTRDASGIRVALRGRMQRGVRNAKGLLKCH